MLDKGPRDARKGTGLHNSVLQKKEETSVVPVAEKKIGCDGTKIKKRRGRRHSAVKIQA